MNYFTDKIAAFDYSLATQEAFDNCQVFVFRKNKKDSAEFYVVLKTDCLNNEILTEVEKWFEAYVTEEFLHKHAPSYLYMTSVACVEKVSPTFYSLVSAYTHKKISIFNLHTGISFGGKTVYISDVMEGPTNPKVLVMRKMFTEIIKDFNEI